jgi:transcription antitermination factor NusG
MPPIFRISWYAIRVQSKFENFVSVTLRGKGYQEFLPVYRSKRRWSDREKEIDLPLFASYLFCRFDVRGRLLPILTTPGVISIVGAGKTPVPVSDVEISLSRPSFGPASQPRRGPVLQSVPES